MTLRQGGASSDQEHAPIGVLFVHGIGEQVESESVRWFAGSLFEWLEAWHSAPGRAKAGFAPEVVSSHLSYGVASMDGPARVEIRIPSHSTGQAVYPERRWVIAEGWWAARIDPPNLGEMVGWAGRSVRRAIARLAGQVAFRLWLIWLGILRRRPPARSEPGLVGALIEFASSSLLLILYLFAIPLALLVVGLLWLITLIPIQKVRETALVQLIEPFLVEGLGDFSTYLEDDIQALHIRERLADDIRWLIEEEHCSELIIVAHSHGTVVAFDALTSGRLPYLDRICKFITVGSALNNAWELYSGYPRVSRTLPGHIFWVDFWSYYDPVPGGQLDRDGPPPLVQPNAELCAEMRWYERYVHPDRGAGPLDPPTSPLPRQLTNGMNVLTDHGGYWRNPEQFLSRLAAEIDVPDRYYGTSRFHLSEVWKRTLLRRRRVTTLVGWRLLAMGAFIAAVVGRALRHGAERIEADGRTFAQAVGAVPGSEILGAPAAVMGGFGEWLGSVAAAPLGPISEAAGRLAELLRSGNWESFWHGTLGTLAYAALFAAVYQLLVYLLWRPWDKDEAEASSAPTAPDPSLRWLPRSILVVMLLGSLAWMIAQ